VPTTNVIRAKPYVASSRTSGLGAVDEAEKRFCRDQPSDSSPMLQRDPQPRHRGRQRGPAKHGGPRSRPRMEVAFAHCVDQLSLSGRCRRPAEMGFMPKPAIRLLGRLLVSWVSVCGRAACATTAAQTQHTTQPTPDCAEWSICAPPTDADGQPGGPTTPDGWAGHRSIGGSDHRRMW